MSRQIDMSLHERMTSVTLLVMTLTACGTAERTDPAAPSQEAQRSRPTVSAPAPPESSAHADPIWKAVDIAGVFTVSLPENPLIESIPMPDGKGGAAPVKVLQGITDRVPHAIRAFVHPRDALSDKDELDAVQEGVTKSAPGAKLIGAKDVKLGKYSGREVTVVGMGEKEEMRITTRFYLVDKNVAHVVVTAPRATFDEQIAARAFESVTLK